MADKLTEKTIAALAAKVVAEGIKEQSVAAGVVPNLALRLRASGSHGWRYTYRPKIGRRSSGTKTVVLGSWPSISADEARRLGKALAGKIAVGEDPAAERRQRKATLHPTVAQALDLYEQQLIRRKIVNVKTAMSALRRGLKSFLPDDITLLDRKGIMRGVNALANAGKAGAAGA